MVPRYYPTEKEVSIGRLRLKLGTSEKTFYVTKHIHHLIQKSSDGIATLPLVFESIKNLKGEVTLPLSREVNKTYRRIRGSIRTLRLYGYIEKKEEEPRRWEEEYYVHSYFLHKELRKGGIERTVRIGEKEYQIRSMSFEEMLRQAILPFFLVGERMLAPTTTFRIAERLGYKESTVEHSLSLLRIYGLIEKSGNRYQLKGEMDKIKRLMETSEKVKRRKVKRLLTCAYFLDFHQGRVIPSEFASEICEVPYGRAFSWLHYDERPRINEKVANLFLEQGLITQEEFQTLDRHGLITYLYVT